MINNDSVFNKIAEALLIDYTSVYYVNAETNEYKWYSINSDFRSLKIEQDGENFFENIAAQKNMPVIGLDNIGETMYMLFDREPFEWQCKELLKVIEYPDNEVKQERAIKEMYRNGRLTDIAYQIEGPNNTTSISYSDYQVYCQRNEQWVKRLAPHLRKGACFITLNAIYIGGEKGLLEQLRTAGYRVRSVNRKLKIK